MDIERINTTLNRAIAGLQGDEIEAMLEAMAHGVTSYDVPSPSGGRGGYIPPSPASMGFAPKPKRKRKPAKTGKWKTQKLTYTIPDRFGHGDDESVDVKASVMGVWAVHKSLGPGSRKSWVVSHTPSGLVVNFGGYTGNSYDRKKDAQRAVETWVSQMPELLKTKTVGSLKKNLRAMKEIAVSITNPSTFDEKAYDDARAKEATMKRLKDAVLKMVDNPYGRSAQDITDHVRFWGRTDPSFKNVPQKDVEQALKELKNSGKIWLTNGGWQLSTRSPRWGAGVR